MKTMKKLLAVILAMTLTMAMGICASATAPGGGDGDGGGDTPQAVTGSITITNAIVNETYTLYKVFDATAVAGREDHNGISYTSEWFTEGNEWFDVDSRGNITITEAGTGTDGKLSDRAIAWLKTQINNFQQTQNPITPTSDAPTVSWTNLDPGYYYIDTTTGSFITVDSITPDVEVEDKNSLPSHDKKQATSANGTFGNDLVELNIGDTVYYQTEIKIGKGSNKDITLTDTMTSGLDLNQSAIIVTKGDAEVPASNYTLTPSAHGFTLVLKADYVKKTLAKDDVVTVSYSAVINDSAAIDSDTGNSNTATLKYSQQTATDTVYVATYDFLLKKTDGVKYLPGSGFKLYGSEDGDDQIKVSRDSETGIYYIDPSAPAADNIMVDQEHGVNVSGLKPGKYYLEETVTPPGYNTLTGRQEFIITSGQTSPKTVTVENNAGTELPSTGGRGTTVLYAVGAALVIGAAILLIARRRTEQ